MHNFYAELLCRFADLTYAGSMAQPQPTTAYLDAHAITVLAHPIRARILALLRQNGPSTATTLARALETNTGATSYHLRKLADVGLVDETSQPDPGEPGRGGKQRWWKPSTDRHAFVASSVAGDPDAEAAHNWLERHYFQILTDQFGDWLDHSRDWPLDWQDAAGLSDYMLTVTPTRARALTAELAEVIERYRTMPAEEDGGIADTRVQVMLYPKITGSVPRRTSNSSTADD